MTDAPKKTKKTIGELLLEKGLISNAQLWEAMRVQSRTGESLSEILIKLGMVTTETIHELMGVQKINLDGLDPELIKLVPEHMLRKYKMLPFKKEDNRLTMLMADPANVLAIDDLRLVTGCKIEPVALEQHVVEEAIRKYFSIPEVEKIFDDFEVTTEQQESETIILEDEVVDEAPVVRLINSIFTQAIEQKASDIHIEPAENYVRVRYRIDGMLQEIMTLPKKIRSTVISRIKIMSNMDIAEKRSPQDGRIMLKLGSQEFDLRVSSLPTVYGEKIVTRLLDKGGMKSYRLENVGFAPESLSVFKDALKSSYGMLLITGPTGSGKTTTLYAALNEINTIEKNIITVEDPVEYMLEGINQTQVNPKARMTFAAGLRAILRQDPDVILVGEIRDSETAQIAVKAATTGHLVLSTLHTNDAAGAFTRLVDMEIEPFLVASSVLGAVAQRLVRLICPKCRQSYVPAPDSPARLFMGIRPDQPLTLYRGAGCNECRNSGYRGRMAILEILPMTAGLRSLILKNASADEVKQKAQAEGMVTLKADGLQKALKGLTTIEEVMRVAYADEN
ncbi:MAG: ATPase, T2SS/T4P/T4SS family [Desulfotomaculaceae bacterium]|nr:ATPase, T2SS/T4P/T4SS family [Desulfotomaculaceae bacterium]